VHLSGYVISREGAKRLLRLLPCRGPVDLWLNHQFGILDVCANAAVHHQSATRHPLHKLLLDTPCTHENRRYHQRKRIIVSCSSN